MSDDRADAGGAVPFYREHKHPDQAALIRALPSKDLCALFDAANNAAEALNGVANQPRCSEQLEDWLDIEMERLSDIRTFAMQEIQRRPMSGDRTDDEERIAYVLNWEFRHCGCSALEAAETLVRMKRESDSAAFDKAYAARHSADGMAA